MAFFNTISTISTISTTSTMKTPNIDACNGSIDINTCSNTININIMKIGRDSKKKYRKHLNFFFRFKPDRTGGGAVFDELLLILILLIPLIPFIPPIP